MTIDRQAFGRKAAIALMARATVRLGERLCA
jgi:hypothetical protein